MDLIICKISGHGIWPTSENLGLKFDTDLIVNNNTNIKLYRNEALHIIFSDSYDSFEPNDYAQCFRNVYKKLKKKHL